MRTDPPRGQGARRSALDTECNYRHRCPRMGHALALYSSRPGVSERSIHSHESPPWPQSTVLVVVSSGEEIACYGDLSRYRSLDVQDASIASTAQRPVALPRSEGACHDYGRRIPNVRKRLPSMGRQGSERRTAQAATTFGKRLDAGRRGARRSACPKRSRLRIGTGRAIYGLTGLRLSRRPWGAIYRARWR